jgi:hypothetical protein
MNIEDFVDAKCRCNLVNWESSNLVNWESIAGSPVQIIQDWNNLHQTNIIFKIGIICNECKLFKIGIICIVTSFDYDSS